MRIQHNIPAMNAYRNYNTNVKSLQGNLQKLSSGYKINKAGDDAAGLAISEKMRAQITGLEVAQKNAKDGISLVQTAEGALTEVHTMLNRMYSLAEQSANGTYADDVDREQLQKEVVSLRDEINRIADASNFNGKKLLDGSLAGGGGGAGKVTTSLATKTVEATNGKYTTEALGAAGVFANLNTTPHKLSFSFSDGNGNDSVVEFTLTAGAASDGTAKRGIYANGELIADNVGTDNQLSANELEDALKEAFKKFEPSINENFDITANAGVITFEAKEKGAGTMQLTSYNSVSGSTVANAKATVTQEANDAFNTIDVAKLVTNQAWDGTEANLEKSIFEVAGEKFVVVKNGVTLGDDAKALLANAGVGNNVVTADATNASTTATNLVEKINQATGISSESGKINAGAWEIDSTATNNTLIALKPGTGKSGGSSKGGLTLQIGDTSEKFNKMTVSVNDCHAKAMGIGSINIGTQDGAAKAMTSIKDAINYVSDVRGTLGSLQNRLDHTINNLSVQQENIQDAESTIRDVDVANEMMAYTKNNILVQSAQAMLAQANQLPQGVLQLLG